MPTQTQAHQRTRSPVPALLLAGVGVGTAWAACPLSGKGTEKSPYQIGTVADLQLVPVACGDTAVFRLTADLDAQDSTLPISSPVAGTDYSQTGFRGTFHGAGHVIRNLKLTPAPSGSGGSRGLFWKTANSASIDSLGLPGIEIHGALRITRLCNPACQPFMAVQGGIGGIVGWNQGSIRRSFVSGNVFYLNESSSSNGSLSMTESEIPIGGISGYNDGSILDCYAILKADNPAIIANPATSNFDPIAWQPTQDRRYRRCYWAIRIPNAVAYGTVDWKEAPTSLSFDQMKHAANFHGFSFAQDSAWTIVEGTSFPLLRGLANAVEATNATVSVRERYSSTTGTQLLTRNGQFLLQLERPARVRIVDLQGKAVSEMEELGAGIHNLAAPSYQGLILVQVQNAEGIRTYRWRTMR